MYLLSLVHQSLNYFSISDRSICEAAAVSASSVKLLTPTDPLPQGYEYPTGTEFHLRTTDR